MDKNVISGRIVENKEARDNFSESFPGNNSQRDVFSEAEMIYPLLYYKSEIKKYAGAYYGFNNSPLEITDLMSVSSITRADKIIPGLLTFLVCWLNQKGYVYWLYGFNNEQEIVLHYYCGDFVAFGGYEKLMGKLPGNVSEHGTVSVNDYNNDGRNEIALYSYYKNKGDVFCVHGLNDIESKLEELCLVPVFINYDKPFPSAEYTGNGFKVLEITDEDPLELQWTHYLWKKETGKYIKE